jgi:hypothetical protein
LGSQLDPLEGAHALGPSPAAQTQATGNYDSD